MGFGVGEGCRENMKLFLSCYECSISQKSEYPEFYEIQIEDFHKYEFTCRNGHNTTNVISNPKFEILFQVGANAIIDGYYREAVSSFASALERFYEICIKTIQASSGVDNETIDKSWKKISSQSERQLGAFIMLWTNFYKEKAEILSSRMVKFRNEVIHKGKIPSREETIKFGDHIYNLITTKLPKIIEEDSYRWLSSKCEPVEVDDKVVIMSGNIQTIISSCFIDKDYTSKNLEEEIEETERLRKLLKRQVIKTS